MNRDVLMNINLKPKELQKIVDIYLHIKDTVINYGYSFEIEWQDSRQFSNLVESEFLSESAWVILSTGFKESVIRNIFYQVSVAFMNWTSARDIVNNANICELNALDVFRSRRKIAAILSLCYRVDEYGFDDIKNLINDNGISFLQSFDFIGPVTCYHLAKNIGLDVVKPDRHLLRIAKATRINDPYQLCSIISNATGDKLSVIDIVLWRYATLNKDYASYFEY